MFCGHALRPRVRPHGPSPGLGAVLLGLALTLEERSLDLPPGPWSFVPADLRATHVDAYPGIAILVGHRDLGARSTCTVPRAVSKITALSPACTSAEPLSTRKRSRLGASDNRRTRCLAPREHGPLRHRESGAAFLAVRTASPMDSSSPRLAAYHFSSEPRSIAVDHALHLGDTRQRRVTREPDEQNGQHGSHGDCDGEAAGVHRFFLTSRAGQRRSASHSRLRSRRSSSAFANRRV